MINTQCNYVRTATIDSAWREVMWLCVRNGYDFLVEGGSYQGQLRKQLEHVTIEIKTPGIRPLSPILPPGIPPPTNDDKIYEYFCKYILGNSKAPNEVYTYGEFITAQYNRILQLLVDSKGNTNQATICIGNQDTTFLDDPPCLRSISFKVVEGKLNMTVYFRSWDLYAGLPENLGGLQILKEIIVDELLGRNLVVEDGSIIAFSDGLHLYDQYFPIVDTLNTDKIKVGAKALKAKELYLELNGC